MEKDKNTKSKKNWWDDVIIGVLHPGPNNIVKKESEELKEKVLISGKEIN
jgi:hypothetical protein